MSRWTVVLVASALSYGVKLAGYLVPPRWVSGAKRSRVIALLPVALFAALVVVQTFTAGDGSLTVDARVIAVLVAVGLLIARANFLVVVLGAAVVAAALRALGMS